MLLLQRDAIITALAIGIAAALYVATFGDLVTTSITGIALPIEGGWTVQ